jgi:hypothetical protein
MELLHIVAAKEVPSHSPVVIAVDFLILFQSFYSPTLNTLFTPLSTFFLRIIQGNDEATTNGYDYLF